MSDRRDRGGCVEVLPRKGSRSAPSLHVEAKMAETEKHGMNVISAKSTTFQSMHNAPSQPPPAKRILTCTTCSSQAALDGSYSCLDCLGSSKVMSKLCQLLKDENSNICPEEVQRRCRAACGLIVGVYKTADNHWQFSVQGNRARLPGILAAATELRWRVSIG